MERFGIEGSDDNYFDKMIQPEANQSSEPSLFIKDPPMMLCVPSLGQSFLWEMVGTALYSIGALMNISNFGKAISMSVAYILIHQMTGGQLNPVMSISLFLRKQIGIYHCVMNIMGQIFGAFFGGILVYLSNVGNTIFPPQIQLGTNDYQAFAQEMIACFFLIIMLNIQNCKISQLTEDTFMSGTYFALVIFTSRQLAVGTGGVLNPALAIGINLSSLTTHEEWASLDKSWIYLTAPLVGSLLATAFFIFAFLPTLQTVQAYQANHKHEAKIT